jgi:peptidyl-Lys metalloendopeptidase
VYLCGAFWNAPTTGSDSKAGTIVHESSHFTKNGGTDDYAYGEQDCQALAKNNQNQAINNADSHEYFAENSPPLQ